MHVHFGKRVAAMVMTACLTMGHVSSQYSERFGRRFSFLRLATIMTMCTVASPSLASTNGSISSEIKRVPEWTRRLAFSFLLVWRVWFVLRLLSFLVLGCPSAWVSHLQRCSHFFHSQKDDGAV